MLHDLDGRLPPEAAASGGPYSARGRRGEQGGGGPPKRAPGQELALVLTDLDGRRAEDAVPPPSGRRRLPGPEVAAGRFDLFPLMQQLAPSQPGSGLVVGDRWIDARSGKHCASPRAAPGGQAAAGAAPRHAGPRGKRLVPGRQGSIA